MYIGKSTLIIREKHLSRQYTSYGIVLEDSELFMHGT